MGIMRCKKGQLSKHDCDTCQEHDSSALTSRLCHHSRGYNFTKIRCESTCIPGRDGARKSKEKPGNVIIHVALEL